MHTFMNTEDFAKFLYGTDSPTKGQCVTVARMCRDGSLKSARRVGRRWIIDCTLEYPDMFPDSPPSAPAVAESPSNQAPTVQITADTTLGELFGMLVAAVSAG